MKAENAVQSLNHFIGSLEYCFSGLTSGKNITALGTEPQNTEGQTDNKVHKIV